MQYKLVVFDCDGVLAEGNVWVEIAKSLGIRRQDHDFKLEYLAGKITYDEWVERILDLYIDKGLTEDLFIKVVENFRLIPGAVQTLAKLKQRGYKTAIISGGVEQRVLLVKQLLGINVAMAANKLIFKRGKIIGIQTKKYDFAGKVRALKKILHHFGIRARQTVYVGDDINDLQIFDLVGLSIAFNCRCRELTQKANVVIKRRNLQEILKYI
jgi:phosphoserine phosphatase